MRQKPKVKGKWIIYTITYFITTQEYQKPKQHYWLLQFYRGQFEIMLKQTPTQSTLLCAVPVKQIKMCFNHQIMIEKNMCLHLINRAELWIHVTHLSVKKRNSQNIVPNLCMCLPALIIKSQDQRTGQQLFLLLLLLLSPLTLILSAETHPEQKLTLLDFKQTSL